MKDEVSVQTTRRHQFVFQPKLKVLMINRQSCVANWLFESHQCCRPSAWGPSAMVNLVHVPGGGWMVACIAERAPIGREFDHILKPSNIIKRYLNRLHVSY